MSKRLSRHSFVSLARSVLGAIFHNNLDGTFTDVAVMTGCA